MENEGVNSNTAIAILRQRQVELQDERAKLNTVKPGVVSKEPQMPQTPTIQKFYTMGLKAAQNVTTYTQERLQKRKLDRKEKVEDKCPCLKIEGHLDAVKWLLWPREYNPSPGYLQIDDWLDHPYIWMHYIERCKENLPKDEVLVNEYQLHWDITGVQRYFIGQFHCEEGLFFYQYPNMKLPTEHGTHLWKINAASKQQSLLFKKEFGISLETTLKKMCHNEEQMDRLIVSDYLIRIKSLDKFKRDRFFKILIKILSFQENLQFVSFENLCCERLEGVRLLQQLACFNSDTLKYLFLWHFVDTFENPSLINFCYIKGPLSFLSSLHT